MNILFLSELFYPHGSGGELATYLYAKLLSEAGINVIVITNRFAGEPDVSKNGKLRVHRLPLFKRGGSIKYSILQRFDILFLSFMRKMFRWADVVYVPRFWYSAIPLAKAYGKPVLVHLHDYISICPLSTIYNVSENAVCNHNGLLCPLKCIYAYERIQDRGFTETIASVALNSTIGRYLGKFVKFSDAVICVSEAQRGVIIKGEPSLRYKTHVIYNPLPELSYIEMEGDDFGYFGGPNALKGFHILRKALTYIGNHGEVKVHATNFSNPAMAQYKILGPLGIIPYGRLSQGPCEMLYKKIRAVIVPSVWPETFSYVSIEAIFRGRLLIASKIGGIPEITKGCDAALLFEAGNHRELAEKLEYVSGLSREVASDMAVRSREVFAKKFSNERTIRDFTSVCSGLA